MGQGKGQLQGKVQGQRQLQEQQGHIREQGQWQQQGQRQGQGRRQVRPQHCLALLSHTPYHCFQYCCRKVHGRGALPWQRWPVG